MGREVPYNLRLPARERRTIFREMAKGEFRRGPISPGRHRALVAYAAKLGIHPTESNELIAEAARDLGLVAATPSAAPSASVFARPVSRRMWLALAAAVVGAAVVHLVGIYV